MKSSASIARLKSGTRSLHCHQLIDDCLGDAKLVALADQDSIISYIQQR
jgi:hypothetical protein